MVIPTILSPVAPFSEVTHTAVDGETEYKTQIGDGAVDDNYDGPHHARTYTLFSMFKFGVFIGS